MEKLRIVLLPMVAYGHLIPIIDMAKLFASRGVKTTIIATPAFAEPIKKAQESGHDFGLSITPFPPQGSSLPNDVVSLDQMTNSDLVPKFFRALELLQQPIETILQELQPNCLISDMFLPWTADSVAKIGIPRLVFHVTGYFAMCCIEQMQLHKPYKNVLSNSEPFVVPNLPHQLTFLRTQVAEFELREDEADENHFLKLQKQMKESEKRSYGGVINSFYELESDYADHYKNVLGKRAWHIGPLPLFNNKAQDKFSQRGKVSAIDQHECLAWLDSKRTNSVVYMCFGSTAKFTPAQLHETAVGLEASGLDFIWVVRRGKNEDENKDWLPQRFEEMIKGRGLGTTTDDS